MRLVDGTVKLCWPLDRHILTQGYNATKHPAIDLRCNWGGTTAQVVRAAEPGTVIWTQQWDGSKSGLQSYGNACRIRHKPYINGRALETLYAHMCTLLVKQGQEVKEGDVIGYTGNTGNSFGAHLHFEVRLNNARVQPLNWLTGDFTKAAENVDPGKYTPVQASETPTMHTVQIGPITDGDFENLKQYCKDLKINKYFREVKQ